MLSFELRPRAAPYVLDEEEEKDTKKGVKEEAQIQKPLVTPWKKLDKFLRHSAIPTAPSSYTIPNYCIEFPCPIDTEPTVRSEEYRKYARLLEKKTRQVNTLLKHYKGERKLVNANHVEQRTTKMAEVPRYVVNLGLDSDQYDCPEYEWLRTGGVLDGIEHEGCPVLLSIHGDSLLRVNNFTEELDTKVYSLRAASIGSHLHVLVRQERKAQLLRIDDLEDLDVITRWDARTTKETRFTDAQLDPFDSTSICTLEDNRTVKIHDISRKSQRYEKRIETRRNLHDELTQAVYFDPHTLVFMDRNAVGLLDLRVNDARLSHSFDSKSNGAVCDDLCNVLTSECGHVFVSSRHSLFKLDFRSVHDAIATMTHMLNTPPLVTTHVGETFCLCGSAHSDKVLITTNNSFISPPQLVPSPIDMLRSTITRFDDEHLEARLRLETIGAKLLKDKLYTQTALDVFEQRFSEDPSSCPDGSKEKFVAWAKQLPKKEVVLRCTEVVNFGKMLESLIASKVDEKYFQKFNKRVDMAALERRLQVNVSQNDVVGQRLLAIWNDNKDK